MLRFENASVSVHLSGLLAAAAALQELAGNLKDLARIPEILRTVLGAESVALSVTRLLPGGAVEVLVQGASALPDAARLEPAAGRAASSDRIISIERELDATHRMNLTIGRMPADTAADPVGDEVLHILSSHLARSMQALLGGLAYPPRLASPFTELTEREWAVLCGLNSEDGEKQVADRMNLSSHTLHSHIKALYRKLGVRGRLALLQRFRMAWQEYRLRMLAQPLEKEEAAGGSGSRITVVEQSSPLGYSPPASAHAKT